MGPRGSAHAPRPPRRARWYTRAVPRAQVLHGTFWYPVCAHVQYWLGRGRGLSEPPCVATAIEAGGGGLHQPPACVLPSPRQPSVSVKGVVRLLHSGKVRNVAVLGGHIDARQLQVTDPLQHKLGVGEERVPGCAHGHMLCAKLARCTHRAAPHCSPLPVNVFRVTTSSAVPPT